MTEAQEPDVERRLEAATRDHADPLHPLCAALEATADPAAARRLAIGILEAREEGGRRLLDALLEDADAARIDVLSRILRALCGVAPFLAPHFRRHPGWLVELIADDLSHPMDGTASRRRLDAALAASDDAADALRQHKYRELARITIRDADPRWVPLAESAVTLGDVSELADILLERALSEAVRTVREQLGPPAWWTTEGERVALGFTVLGLGKLGSQELNYSSDVDLVYVHASPPAPLDHGRTGDDDTARLSPPDYFTRLAQTFGRLVTSVTAAGFLYRIDLDLRPEGAQGAVVTSADALSTYYEAWADTWERAAFMKARPVAGDLDLGWQVIRELAPMIYHSTMDYGAVESIRSLKQRVEDTHGGRDAGFNVKIDAGGIRDVEFVAQALQLLHGGRIPQVRERSTQRALRNLADVDLIPPGDAERLLGAYRLLRRIENRLQMEDEKQRHVVPADDAARRSLAISTGYLAPADGPTAPDRDGALARFDADLDAARRTVEEIGRRTFASDDRDRIRELFLRHAYALASQPGMKGLIDDLAGRFARCIDDVPDPERALNNLDRFLDGVGTRRFYYELLLERPEIVARLTALFSASRFLSSYLASHPRLIEPVFADPNVLLLSRAALDADYAATRASLDDSDESALDALRIFQHRQVLNVGLLDLAGEVGRAEVEGALTEIAEVCLDAALGLAEGQLARGRDGIPEAARRGGYLVVGMGKLGSRELTYGSDLDLIFLYDLAPEDREAGAFAQHHYVRLTQRLISALQTATGEGSCYEIDARLRPSGNQGTLVTSLDAFSRYHDASAAVWERQALLRARPVAGHPALAERFDALRTAILERPVASDAVTEVDEIRKRMENELAQETGARRNFKTGRGGLLDVETVVQLVQLRQGASHPELLRPDRLEHHLDTIAAHDLLDATDVEVLRSGWEFLQHLASRLRIVENRSISDLDAERGDLEALARHVGYAPGSREGGARRALLRDYRRHTEAIRSVYDRFVAAAKRGDGA
jgi:glutamate-ammonia-ligase adenylyltransferase